MSGVAAMCLRDHENRKRERKKRLDLPTLTRIEFFEILLLVFRVHINLAGLHNQHFTFAFGQHRDACRAQN